MRLARVEVLDSHGHPLLVHDVHAWPLSIGRALDNDLVLADPHVAAHHAELAPGADGALVLTLRETRNGAVIEYPRDGALGGALDGALGEHARRHEALVAAGATSPLPPEARARLGRTLLRVQRAADPLPDELPLAAGPTAAAAAPRWQLPLLLVAVLAWQVLLVWLQDRPDAKPLDQIGPLLGLASGVLLWAGAWGLMTKLFSARFVVVPHLRLVLIALLGSAALGFVLPALAFVLDLPLLSRVRAWADVAIAAWLVSRHLAMVIPRHARSAAVVVGVIALATLGFQVANHWQRNDRVFAELYADMLLPPAWRLAPTRPIDSVVQELKTLEQPLTERSRKAREDEFEP